MIGLDTALGEITLVLFTTLAPAGAMALLLMGLPILSGRASWAEVRRISTYLCLPLIVSMVGLVALASYAVGRCTSLTARRTQGLIALAAGALGASVVVYGLQGIDLGNVGNAVASATDLVPAYGAAVAAFALLGAAGIGVAWRTTRDLPADGTPPAGTTRYRLVGRLCAAATLGLAAIFIMRFCFYLAHLTVGLGV